MRSEAMLIEIRGLVRAYMVVIADLGSTFILLNNVIEKLWVVWNRLHEGSQKNKWAQ